MKTMANTIKLLDNPSVPDKMKVEACYERNRTLYLNVYNRLQKCEKMEVFTVEDILLNTLFKPYEVQYRLNPKDPAVKAQNPDLEDMLLSEVDIAKHMVDLNQLKYGELFQKLLFDLDYQDNAYGEPETDLMLDNGRRIKVTKNTNNIAPDYQSFSLSLYCNGEEYAYDEKLERYEGMLFSMKSSVSLENLYLSFVQLLEKNEQLPIHTPAHKTPYCFKQTDFSFTDEVEINPDGLSLNGYLENTTELLLHLNAEIYLNYGANRLDETDNINFYCDYNLVNHEITLSGFFSLQDEEHRKVLIIPLQSEEKKALMQAFEAYIYDRYGSSALDFLNELRKEDGLLALGETNVLKIETELGTLCVSKAEGDFPGFVVTLRGENINDRFGDKDTYLAKVEYNPFEKQFQTDVYGDGNLESPTAIIHHENILKNEEIKKGRKQHSSENFGLDEQLDSIKQKQSTNGFSKRAGKEPEQQHPIR